MKRAIIEPNRCLGCEECEVVRVCESRAVIREEPTQKPWIDFMNCTGCMKCKTVCRGQAMQFAVQPCTGRGRMSW